MKLLKLPFTLLIRIYYKLNPSQYRIDKWLNEGKPVPPPREIKVKTIKEFNKKYPSKIFIETGTFLGDTTFDLRKSFKFLYTIELSNELYLNATAKFKQYDNIEVLNGDSGIVLNNLLKKIKSVRILFWLDGHYSEGITAKSDLVTPIMNELKSIREHEISTGCNHVILIDDAHLFNGIDDYPELNSFVGYCQTNFKERNIEIVNNIIVINP
jgi:hypothetical protein